MANVETTEQLISDPANRSDEAKATAPRFQSTTREDRSRHSEDKQEPSSASGLLSAFSNVTLLYDERRSIPSLYIPSSKMMFYVVHQMNDLLCDSIGFQQTCPNYHPYIFRLYCGVLFWIQCLRAQSHAGMATVQQSAFLRVFLEQFPLESLPIPGPLLLLFKTLCASTPELDHYGLVAPRIPDRCGPARRSRFLKDHVSAHFMPNVPGIFALLSHLKTCFTGADFPAKGSHCPVGNTAVEFGFHQFGIHSARSANEKWSLISPGLDYPCEADSQLHRNFSRHILNFGFPTLHADDNLVRVDKFLSLHKEMQWFSNVRNVASCISAFFKNSRTLNECPPFGLNANQYLVEYLPARHMPTAPTMIADPTSAFPFSIKVTTSVRNIHQPTVATAACAQTNVVAPEYHLHFATFGDTSTTRSGDFWNIWPTDSSGRNDQGYLGLRTVIRNYFQSGS